MAVTYDPPIQIDATSWKQTFTSDQTPPVTFRVFREGVKISEWINPTAATGEIVLTASAGEFPFIEVLDLADDREQLAYPGSVTLFWYAISGAASYRVEEYVSAAWTLRQSVADNGAGSFTWRSRWLEDVTQHQFRVLPVDAAGNIGASPLSLTVTMVRHPDVPDVAYAYNGAGTPTVTITAN